MPDISMCSDDNCLVRTRCYRHKDSGTKPNDPWQTYAGFTASDANGCSDFMDRVVTANPPTISKMPMLHMAIEVLAEVWASMGGKSAEFETGKNGMDEYGYYSKYYTEAKEFVRRLNKRGFVLWDISDKNAPLSNS